MRSFLILICLLHVFLSSCGEFGDDDNEIGISSTKGFHFQGRDCLSCHNVDLEDDQSLLIGGTVFRVQSGADVNNIEHACSSEIRIQLLDLNQKIIFDSNSYRDAESKGYKGQGNFFVLSRELSKFKGTEYFIRVLTWSGSELNQSPSIHNFNSSYDPDNPSDKNNRFSCNACHSAKPQSDAPGFIYPKSNIDKC